MENTEDLNIPLMFIVDWSVPKQSYVFISVDFIEVTLRFVDFVIGNNQHNLQMDYISYFIKTNKNFKALQTL